MKTKNFLLLLLGYLLTSCLDFLSSAPNCCGDMFCGNKHIPHPDNIKNTPYHIICYRKHAIEQKSSNIPVYLESAYKFKNYLTEVCSQTIRKITLENGKTGNWFASPNVTIITKDTKEIEIKAIYKASRCWVKAVMANGDEVVNYFKTEPRVHVSIRNLKPHYLYGRMVHVMVSNGKGSYKYYFNGRLIKTSSSSSETIHGIDKKGGTLKVVTQDICGRRAEVTEIISPSKNLGFLGDRP